jgi:hypothetical protein
VLRAARAVQKTVPYVEPFARWRIDQDDFGQRRGAFATPCSGDLAVVTSEDQYSASRFRVSVVFIEASNRPPKVPLVSAVELPRDRTACGRPQVTEFEGYGHGRECTSGFKTDSR